MHLKQLSLINILQDGLNYDIRKFQSSIMIIIYIKTYSKNNNLATYF